MASGNTAYLSFLMPTRPVAVFHLLDPKNISLYWPSGFAVAKTILKSSPEIKSFDLSRGHQNTGAGYHPLSRFHTLFVIVVFDIRNLITSHRFRTEILKG